MLRCRKRKSEQTTSDLSMSVRVQSETMTGCVFQECKESTFAVDFVSTLTCSKFISILQSAAVSVVQMFNASFPSSIGSVPHLSPRWSATSSSCNAKVRASTVLVGCSLSLAFAPLPPSTVRSKLLCASSISFFTKARSRLQSRLWLPQNASFFT